MLFENGGHFVLASIINSGPPSCVAENGGAHRDAGWVYRHWGVDIRGIVFEPHRRGAGHIASQPAAL